MKKGFFLMLLLSSGVFLQLLVAQQNLQQSEQDFAFQEVEISNRVNISSPSFPFESEVEQKLITHEDEKDYLLQNKKVEKADLKMQQFGSINPDTVLTDTTQIKPKLHPLIPAGAGVFAAGVGLTAVSVLSSTLSIFIGIAAIVAGVFLVNWGYKKVKADPKKWKGEKLSLAIYYALIPVGLFLMLYPVYLLFVL